MDRFECMRAFVETVKANGFSAAARVLDVPRSKISKQVRALEDDLGVQLLMRTTRSLSLTAAGSDYFEAARDVLISVDDADQRLREGAGQIRGPLRINAPVSFGIRVLAPVLPQFHRAHPEVELQITLTDQQIDPIAGGYDVTIRIANLVDSSLAARQVMPAPRILVASPGYLQQRGTPEAPGDLKDHVCLHYGWIQGGTTLALTRGNDMQRVHTRGPLLADNGDLLAIAAEGDMGIALLPAFIVDDALVAGRLQVVLPEWQAPPIAVHALFPATRRVPQKTRRFIDFLVQVLQPR